MLKFLTKANLVSFLKGLGAVDGAIVSGLLVYGKAVPAAMPEITTVLAVGAAVTAVVASLLAAVGAQPPPQA